MDRQLAMNWTKAPRDCQSPAWGATRYRAGCIGDMMRRLLVSLAIVVGALGTLGQDATADGAQHHRWSWLGENGGTYWYVPAENLLAFRWDTSAPRAAIPVNDQTVWHIERYDGGYIFGPIVVNLARLPRLCQYLIGSVTPDGRVYISFN